MGRTIFVVSEAGGRLHEVEGFQDRASIGGIPARLRLRLRTWAGVYHTVRMAPAVAVSAPEDMVELLAAIPQIRKGVLARPATCMLLVAPSQVSTIVGVLQEVRLRIKETLDTSRSWEEYSEESAAHGKRQSTKEVLATLERAIEEEREVLLPYRTVEGITVPALRVSPLLLGRSGGTYALEAETTRGDHLLLSVDRILAVRSVWYRAGMAGDYASR